MVMFGKKEFKDVCLFDSLRVGDFYQRMAQKYFAIDLLAPMRNI